MTTKCAFLGVLKSMGLIGIRAGVGVTKSVLFGGMKNTESDV